MNQPALSRRDALKVSVLGAAALALPWQRTASAKRASRFDRDELPRPYRAPFVVPPVLSPVRSDATTDYYRIVQRPFDGELISGVRTPLWGYEGSFPGPTIRAQKGRQVVARMVNELPATHPSLGYVPWTSTHLHGSPSEPQYDGYASDISLPGQWKDYVFPNSCEARTIWYHDHGQHHTAENVYMGLAAMYVVTDDIEQNLPIPHGDYDVPLILNDVAFAEDGSLLWDDNDHSGAFGDVILVNGQPWPKMEVEQRKYRFRVLNASVARGFRLRLSNRRPFWVIGTDGGLMSEPRRVTQITVGMAERYEIIIDFAEFDEGTKINLINRGVDNSVDYDHTNKVMQFQVVRPARDLTDNEVPATLAPVHPVMQLRAKDAKKKRYMRLHKDGDIWVINDDTWQDVVDSGYERVFANPEPGDVEIWDIENKSGGWFHPTHIHFLDFQILSRNGRRPRPEENGPKDVVYVGENERVRLLMKFGEPGGTEGRFMIHCHNLSHEDHDMMIQYQIGEHRADNDPINTAPPQFGPETPL